MSHHHLHPVILATFAGLGLCAWWAVGQGKYDNRYLTPSLILEKPSTGFRVRSMTELYLAYQATGETERAERLFEIATPLGGAYAFKAYQEVAIEQQTHGEPVYLCLRPAGLPFCYWNLDTQALVVSQLK